jgi:hypothetical protein
MLKKILLGLNYFYFQDSDCLTVMVEKLETDEDEYVCRFTINMIF